VSDKAQVIFREDNRKTIRSCDIEVIEDDGNFTLIINGHVIADLDADGIKMLRRACGVAEDLNREPAQERYFREIEEEVPR
jgi:hypothetical protein